MARQNIQIGQIYCKSDDLSRRRWQITQLFQHPDGIHALRTQVRLGRTSVSTIEILEGLREGDQAILSDMSAWDDYDRIRLN